MVVYVFSAKTDQYDVGSVRNHFAIPGDALCPVRAWQEYEAHFPQRLFGSERAWALGRYTDGRAVRREEIQGWLEPAAVALDTDPARTGGHSLRIGGANALYHANRGT